MKSKVIRCLLFWLLAALVILQTSCGTANEGNEVRTDPDTQNSQISALEITVDDARIPLVRHQGEAHFSIDGLLNVIGYQYNRDADSLAIGDIDPFYTITLQSRKAEKEEEAIELSGIPRLIDGKVHVPVSVLEDLFQQDIHYAVREDGLIVHPVSDEAFTMEEMESIDQPVLDGEFFFQDDPQDPFASEEEQAAWNLDDGQAMGSLSIKNVNINALIRTAKKYKGVPYKFGAKPYPISKKFDCSSYTRYVFGKYGVKLARVSRNQAKQGVYVSRKNLRKGDLLFFSVPGRFKSKNTVGHVGIYLGKGKMIDTYSKKYGVKITNVNKGFWANKYVTARRVAY